MQCISTICFSTLFKIINRTLTRQSKKVPPRNDCHNSDTFLAGRNLSSGKAHPKFPAGKPAIRRCGRTARPRRAATHERPPKRERFVSRSFSADFSHDLRGTSRPCPGRPPRFCRCLGRAQEGSCRPPRRDADAAQENSGAFRLFLPERQRRRAQQGLPGPTRGRQENARPRRRAIAPDGRRGAEEKQRRPAAAKVRPPFPPAGPP